jgi:hypothetical protein
MMLLSVYKIGQEHEKKTACFELQKITVINILGVIVT